MNSHRIWREEDPHAPPFKIRIDFPSGVQSKHQLSLKCSMMDWKGIHQKGLTGDRGLSLNHYHSTRKEGGGSGARRRRLNSYSNSY